MADEQAWDTPGRAGFDALFAAIDVSHRLTGPPSDCVAAAADIGAPLQQRSETMRYASDDRVPRSTAQSRLAVTAAGGRRLAAPPYPPNAVTPPREPESSSLDDMADDDHDNDDEKRRVDGGGQVQEDARVALGGLESVKVPALDRVSARKLPAALRQIADHNPRGVLESGVSVRGRRKRKAVKMADFVSGAPSGRHRVRNTATSKVGSKLRRIIPAMNNPRSDHYGVQLPQAPVKPSPPESPVTARRNDKAHSAHPTEDVHPQPVPTTTGSAASHTNPKMMTLNKSFLVLNRDKQSPTNDTSVLVELSRSTNASGEQEEALATVASSLHCQAAAKTAPNPALQSPSPLRRPLDDVELVDLSCDAQKEDLPMELRRLLDFNGKGATEGAVVGRRKRKQPKPFTPDDSPTKSTSSRKVGQSHNPVPGATTKKVRVKSKKTILGKEAASAQHSDLPLEMRRLLDFNRKGLMEKGLAMSCSDTGGPDGGPATGYTAVREETAPPLKPPRFSAEIAASDEAPSHKLWIMLSPASHRRFVKAMGGQYRYKQHVPTPAFLREHGYQFSIHVHEEGEFIATVGWSHIVLSGNSRGFSWSQLDPSAIERIELSDAKFGSRQADGKPNSFSAYFARSDAIMDRLKSTLKSSGLWEHSEDDVRRHVSNTMVDVGAQRRREAEGWRPAEIRPVYLPTVAQLEDPKWFTALMSGPGKEQGSLHIRFPDAWRQSCKHNYGHVSWTPATRLWKLGVSEHSLPVRDGDDDCAMVSVKVVRPESRGFDRKQAMQELSIRVPTAPADLTDFIGLLPTIAKRTQLFYGPQTTVSREQQLELQRVMPSWALPESEIDGMRDAFSRPAEGTTTPSGFGGRFGVTGLHDEYNHTVSIFVYPWTTPLDSPPSVDVKREAPL
mmetsp:Transcript_35157/g.91996  ORF Transcript_35157/g.91996 Transcript_35157/m.91996 type:complete len:899 (+) Transcript_35157:44-2740(+)|eukprot:CAMPEP_0182945934 /NCGR_PEP_ID=MMETSP0105_2-20130417/56270_1 /TAXON_ID=81532 ORGANISM="Acanthoeca-like sp., Strain 10tr" /NCGR_SAMPLE_ID=MMETSP0105_2 /ASSEMBLY_ACC=CAM_ASM_000205 /LENGTH=898 /DNA_ID=CAMNT_0025086003 /DNA_START=39 /DNA_END=2735 /DNA_ORIENTATION=-